MEKKTVTFNDGKDIIIEYLDYMNGVNKTNKTNTYQIYIFIFFRLPTQNETFTAKYDRVLRRTP